MRGYDTIAGAWDETTRDWQDVPWQTVTVNPSSETTKYTLNLPLIQFTRSEVPSQSRMATSVQCSLPKVLYGTNVKTLPIDDHIDALKKVDDLIQRWFPGAPSVSEMTPRRIDATDDRDLGSEMRVRACLRLMQEQVIRGRKPYVGDRGSVNWSGKKGGHRTRTYGKFLECADHGSDLGAEDPTGKLRVEREALGLKSVRADYLKAVALAQENGHLTLGQALAAPGLVGVILGPLPALVDAVLKEVEDVKVPEFIDKCLAAGLSYPRAMSMMGYAHSVQVCGWEGQMITRQGIAKLKGDFNRAGIDPFLVEWGPVSKHLTKPYQASKRAVARLEQKQAMEDMNEQESTSGAVVQAL